MPAPLRLSRLALTAFRSHARSVVEPGEGPVVLVGANGAGKTNLLEAISLLSPGRGLRGAAPEELARRGGPGGWKVAAELAPGGHEVETFAEEGGRRQVRIDGKAAPQVALGRTLRVLWLVPAMDRLFTEAPEGRRRFLDRVAMSFLPDHASQVLAYEHAMRERNRLLREGGPDPRWLAALEARMAEAGAAMTRARQAAIARLAAAQDEAGPFPVAALALEAPDAAEAMDAPEALAAALAAARPRDLAAGRTTIGPHRADLAATWAAKDLPARLCSTGEQKALLVSLVLANARALAAEREPPLLLLDEVAAHLDAGRRAALYAEIAALGLAAWMTGTEPALFDGLAGARAFEVRETGSGSRVEPM